MSNKKVTIIKNIFGLIILFFAVLPAVLKADVSLITLTPGNPTTLSNGKGYYLAGKDYSFQVRVIEPDAADWTSIAQLRVQIPNTTNIEFSVNPNSTSVAYVSGIASGVSAALSGTCNDFTYTFTVNLPWTVAESVWSTGRSVFAECTSTNTVSTTVLLSYGVCSSVQALNLSMDGDASDELVNRYHQSFNVAADAIVYNVPGAAYADRVDSIDSGELTSVNILFDSNAVGSDSAFPAISIASGNAELNTLGYTYSTTPIVVALRVNLSGGYVETTQNSLNLTCNEVEVTDFGFSGGGGIDNSPNYFRSLNTPGANAFVNVRMRAGGAGMSGVVYVVLRDTTDGTLTTVSVSSGGTSGTGALTYTGISVAALDTAARNYEIYNVYGGGYGSAAGFGQYANLSARISQPANRIITWDNADPPGSNSPYFVSSSGSGTTSSTATIIWDSSTLTSDDDDIYSYQIYYRILGSSDAYTVLNSTVTGYNTLDSTHGDLSLRTTNTAEITNLDFLTQYEIILSAIDLFGNEVDSANRLSYTVLTLPAEMTVDISDGITTYKDAVFTPETPTDRPLRDTAIKVLVYLVTSGSLPDELNIIAAPYAAGDLVTAGSLNGVEGTDYFRYSTYRVGPNTWQTFIPSESTLIQTGNSVRVIIETVEAGTSSYTDSDSEIEGSSGSPNNFEWTFCINVPVTVTPWPLRILNNVITKKNPVAYPAYYLSEDSYVTITVYDMKGRALFKLLDKAPRKGGVNIKDNGWKGRNSKGNKVGPGLYYIKVEAKSIASGKKILNETKKVVVAE